jgi:UPF0042 nucleotide-binding protein
MKLVIVTGLSGSGKSVALHALEDLGYYCIDNLPVFLLEGFVSRLQGQGDDFYRLAAIGIDARNQSSGLKQAKKQVTMLRDKGLQCEIIFLEAQPDTLIRRFSETRRKHPLTGPNRPLAEAIKLERQLLEPFLSDADLHIDTTHTNVHELRDIVRTRLGDPEGMTLSLLFQSFGFKHSVPADADFVFDVRCLPNPHWQTELRPLTGLDEKVIDFLEKDGSVNSMREDLVGFLENWIPRFEADGRSYVTVAVGCTGGQHRSVYMAEKLAAHFRDKGRKVLTRHRELS